MHNLNEQLAKLATLIETYGGCRSVKVVGKVDCKGDIDFSVDAKLVEIEDQQDPTKLTKLIAGYFESFIEDPTPNWVVEAFVELHKDGTHKRTHHNRALKNPRSFIYTISTQVNTNGRSTKKWRIDPPSKGLHVNSFTVNDETVMAYRITTDANPNAWYGSSRYGTVVLDVSTGGITLKGGKDNKGTYLLVHFSGEQSYSTTNGTEISDLINKANANK